MTRFQVIMIFLLGYLMMTAGFVWQFGQYGLMGAGAVLAVVSILGIDVRSGDSG
jgi:hypothetical protein